ncbi:MAG: 1-deoxy-D-xylulose-5-phosphate reductoisomerase [Planctomycetes bacterium]|nr:1-deoxy-D-xylulose-5-phosphate reductoisomerase [Planctomycetota bacterium]MBI3844664.1 1-deoxy-D-xylulose-5-phosphate reductoisomerase [Planctomycetota bacterium]
MKRIVLLGSTGSVGRSALEVVDSHPDRFRVEGLAAGSRWQDLARQVLRYRPRFCAIADPAAVAELRRALEGTGTSVLAGNDGIREMVTHRDVDVVLSAMTGAAGLMPAVESVRARKRLALANKEALVIGGETLTSLARENGAEIIPVDSEHSAIFQALRCGARPEVRRLILTASGGPFRDTPEAEMQSVTPERALRHPTWTMGRRITIDSATMMNKAMEVVEAHWLFDVPLDRIEVWVHPQSIVHSMVEFIDGSVIAQLGVPDMKIPIQFALSYPDRYRSNSRSLEVSDLSSLTFLRPDRRRFPCLEIGYRAGEAGGVAASVMNGADERAVARFLEGDLSFVKIAEVVGTVLEQHLQRRNGERRAGSPPSVEEILAADAWARREVDRCS